MMEIVHEDNPCSKIRLPLYLLTDKFKTTGNIGKNNRDIKVL